MTQSPTAVGFHHPPVSPQLDSARIFGIVDDIECVSIVADTGLENFSRISIMQINLRLFGIPIKHFENGAIFLDRLEFFLCMGRL